MDFLKRWDFLFGLIGVIGAIFGVYAYIANYKVGRISYVFDTQKVFDPANLSGFTLVTPNKIPVDKRVYATELVIWNSGDLSLSEGSDRVREPLQIKIANSTIYYHIVGAHNLVDEANYSIDDSSDKSSITIHWKYFDPGQGLRITILHSEVGEPSISLTGRFFETSLSAEKTSPKSLPGDDGHRFIVGSALALIIGVLLVIFGPNPDTVMDQFRKSPDRIARFGRLFAKLAVSKFIGFILALQGGTFLILGLYLFYTYRVPPV